MTQVDVDGWSPRRAAAVSVPLQRPKLPSLDVVGPYYARSESARWYSNGGPCVTEFEQRLRDATGAGSVLVSNCTFGLIVAIRASVTAFGTSDRSLVLCPSYTFVATAASIRSAGFEPVFVDVDPVHWQPDPAAVDEALSRYGDDIAAVLVTSTFGCPPDPCARDRWETSCRDAGVPLVVDSAAAFGATAADGAFLGRQGDVEVFSFHATKPFAIGEGGAVTTADPAIETLVRQMINFGFDSTRTIVTEGTNAKMSELQAAVGLAAWDRYDDVLAARRLRARSIQQHLAPEGFQFQHWHELGTWQLVPVLARSADDRATILARAEDLGVELRCYYDQPLHLAIPYRDCASVGDLGVTLDLASRTMSLPMSNDLGAEEIVHIIRAVGGDDAATRAVAAFDHGPVPQRLVAAPGARES